MTRNPYAVEDADRDFVVGNLGVDARARFILRTYGHVAGSLVAFVLLEVVLFATGAAEAINTRMTGMWMVVLGAFIVVGWGATRVAHTARSLAAQYAALGAYIFLEALIFVPLLWYAEQIAPQAIASAALVTLLGTGGLSAIVFLTRRDFSWLRGILAFAGIMALVGIFASLFFGFELGVWFSVGMITLAGGSILYDTSNIIHHYPEDRYVGAALELFASVALLFWYVLQLFLRSRD
jgi:hypothetical protein